MDSTTPPTVSRNFYLIGHGCNDIEKINKALKQKVNGIECDLWADDDKKWWISHEGLTKTDLLEWLNYIPRAEKKYKRQLSIIIFDVKTSEPFKGVRDIINSTLPKDLPRIYSTAKIDKAHIFAEIVPLLNECEGIAIDEEDDPAEVAAFFKKIGATQCWYGNGITLIPLNEEFHESMQKAAPIRDTTGPFSKIYTWSVHRSEALRKYIEEDKVDGVIVGLNSIFSRPVSSALKIIRDNEEVQLAERNSKIF
ncbi:hypothetical protein [Segetibacter aerophilus]|uniref:GP-PDE domain-containing protein n=1 Tax=Segetibacter aerophilus TaxID=670293 RepID=A0A512BIA4_9BACT|nr:hypothetical protein [Segetibacter aerophilus]GEO11702.1 hypothetical protein SAE01_41980 [Segetibacter aerophilus]